MRAHAAMVLLVLAAPTALPADTVLEDETVRFRVDISPPELFLGKRFEVRIELSYPKGTAVYFPETPVTRPFVLVSHRHDAPAVAGEAEGEVHVLELLPVRLGTSVLAPIEVPYVAPSGEARVARTPEVRIQVAGTLGDETDPRPAPAGAPIPVRVPNTPLIWTLFALGVALVAAVAGALGYRRLKAWREARRPPPPPRPPHEVALERLAGAEGLLAAGDFDRLALLVSEVVRTFLGAHFGFAGEDMTTFEVIRAVEGRDLGRLSLVELDDFLGLCDLVKFARLVPSQAEAEGLVRRAREVVEKVHAGTLAGGAP